jgi:hypothetical protein
MAVLIFEQNMSLDVNIMTIVVGMGNLHRTSRREESPALTSRHTASSSPLLQAAK